VVRSGGRSLTVAPLSALIRRRPDRAPLTVGLLRTKTTWLMVAAGLAATAEPELGTAFLGLGPLLSAAFRARVTLGTPGAGLVALLSDMTRRLADKIDEAVAYLDDAVAHTRLDPLTLEEVSALQAAANRLTAAVDAYIARRGLKAPIRRRPR